MKEKYILGIDTTFHSTGVGLIDKNGRVVLNKKINIDFTADENAKRFFSSHVRNLNLLLKPIIKQYLNDVFLISVVNERGPFHSMPVGAITAVSLSNFFDKKLVGVDHEIGHLYANWLERKQNNLNFPILSLSISGAHTNIWLMKNHRQIETVKKILFFDQRKNFSGLGALLGWIAYACLDLRLKNGEAGPYLEKMALIGKPKYSHYFNIIGKNKGDTVLFFDLKKHLFEKVKQIKKTNKNDKHFKNDLSRSLLETLFDAIINTVKEACVQYQPKEIHLTGGAGRNKIIINKLNIFCDANNLDFKSPLKLEFCGDNGAMAASAGYYKWKHMNAKKKKENEFISIEPSDWYYEYYVNKFIK